MIAATTDWVCAGHSCWRGNAAVPAASTSVLDSLHTVTNRVGAQQWIRYAIDLEAVPPAPDDVTLTPLSAAIVEQLRSHPDSAQEAFASGLSFWDMGIRGGLIWMDDGHPLCIQFLLGDEDVAKLRARSRWANMYPPLERGTAQLEKLWTFSTARQKGVASRYALAMFAAARAAGYRSLITHIHDENAAARAWAVRTGWQSYGTIVRYQLDFPVIRKFNLSVCAHRREAESLNGR